MHLGPRKSEVRASKQNGCKMLKTLARRALVTGVVAGYRYRRLPVACPNAAAAESNVKPQ
jgi:hypothetical protein